MTDGSSGRQVASLDEHRWYEPLPVSPAVRTGDLVVVGAQVAVDADRRVVGPGDVRTQTRVIFQYLDALLRQAGGTLDDLVDLRSFHLDVRDADAVLEVAAEFLTSDPPAWTLTGFSGSHVAGALVAIRAVAHVGSEPKECFIPDAAVWLRELPMSSAVRKGPYLFIAGQSAADEAGAVHGPMDHCDQARTAYRRIGEVLEHFGGGFDDVLDFSSFHQDIRGAIPTLEQIYLPEIMGPIDTDVAATTSHIGAPALHRPGMLGTYSALADLTPGRRVASTPDDIWWKGVYPIAGAARKESGRLITVAGQVAEGSDGAIVAPGDVDGQLRYVLDLIRQSLEGFGASLADVVEVSSYHKDSRWFDAAMRAAGELFGAGEGGPAWSFSAVPGMWKEGFLHEISALAVV